MTQALDGHTHEACTGLHPAPGLARAAWRIDGLD